MGARGSEWFATEETTCMIYSRDFFNIDNCTLYNEGNACDFISIHLIEITFYNDNIHIINYLSKRYMHGYLVSKLIISKN